MLGVGVGFDTEGAGGCIVQGFSTEGGKVRHLVEDSREGWVESVAILIDAGLIGGPCPTFDYSGIRPKGSPIKGFGGVANGPEGLERLHNQIRSVLLTHAGQRNSKFAQIVPSWHQVNPKLASSWPHVGPCWLKLTPS